MQKTIQGVNVPALGFGTYELQGEACKEAVSTAIKAGYRHIDAARAYENEAFVGSAMTETGIVRDELFLVSKIWFEDLEEIGKKHGVSAEQVALRWLLEQPNVAAIPRSGNPDHIRENLRVTELVLDGDDRRRIEELPDNVRKIDPEFAPAWEK